MTKNSMKFQHIFIFPFLMLPFFVGVVTVQAKTYYVAITGNDTNSGTSDSPFRTIQRCVNTVVAGDTCTVAAGTYTDSENKGVVAYISSGSPSGTASQPITIKSTNPFAAVITVPGLNANSGFFVTQPYYIIDGFTITGGTGTGTSASNIGIYLTASAKGTIVRNNKIHHIGRTVCSNSGFGFAGILSSASSITIENNLLYSIGRLKNGENGCSTSLTHNDHGLYIAGGSDIVIRRNVIYDTNRGWPLHFYGGTVTNASVYHNVLAGHNTTTTIAGQIMLASTVNNMTIANNISHDATIGMIQFHNLNASGVSVSYNLSDTVEKISTYPGVTFSNNIQNTRCGFVDVTKNDFHLNTGSAAIDAGTKVGLPFNGAAPDIGAYESGENSTLPAAPQNLKVQ